MASFPRAFFTAFVLFSFVSTNGLAQSTNTSKAELDALFTTTQANKRISADSLVAIGQRLQRSGKAIRYDDAVVNGNLLRGRGFFLRNQLDSASSTLLWVVNNARTESLAYGLGHNYLGSVYLRLSNYKRALSEFETARVTFASLKNNEYIALATSNIGTVYITQGDHVKALEHLIEAQKTAQLPGVPSSQRASISGNIAVVYNLTNQPVEALRYAFAALQLDRSTNDTLGICASYNSIANIYSNSGKLDSAIYFYDKTQATAKLSRREFIPIVSRAIINKSLIYTDQGKIPQAIRMIRGVLATNQVFQTETMYNNLARNYTKLHNNDSALYFSRKALTAAKRANTTISIRNAYDNFQTIYANMKRYDSAYHYKILHHAYSDSVSQQNNQSKFDALKVELETLAKQQELDQAKNEIAVNKLRTTLISVFIAGGFLITVFILSTIILSYKNRQKKQLIKTRALETELEKRNTDLRHQALKMIYINNALQEVEETLKKVKAQSSGTDIQRVLSTLQVNRSLEKEWDSFNEYFGHIHAGFFDKLDTDFPLVTVAEKRLAGLVRMNLKNKEIAGILGIEYSSVKMAKHRLKKKLGLTDEQNLYTFLVNLTGSPINIDADVEEEA